MTADQGLPCQLAGMRAATPGPAFFATRTVNSPPLKGKPKQRRRDGLAVAWSGVRFAGGRNAMVGMQALKRVAQPDDIADAVAFSDAWRNRGETMRVNAPGTVPGAKIGGAGGRNRTDTPCGTGF